MKNTYIQLLKNALVFMLLCLVMISCKPKDIDIDLPLHQPKLSIFSQVIPDRVILVTVTKSFNSLAPADSSKGDSALINQLMVSNAIVTVTFAGRTETLENTDPGIYVSTNTLQIPNEQYTLHVKDPATGLECSATSAMLPRVDFDEVKTIIEKTTSDTNIAIEYRFTDMPAKENFYLVSYTPFRKNSKPNNNPFLSIQPVNNTYQLLSDKLFTEGKYTGKLPLDSKLGDTIAVSLTNISEAYYKYLVVYQKSGKVFNQITGEPIDFPTNVTNGYGFFTTHNPDVKILKLK
ncbi:MAG: DUF4249 domain-containing protein [Sphingobacteriales bacterium]|nr:MAG: DUF4249 domain-containing protein [Sphingobacteriales bacterium]